MGPLIVAADGGAKKISGLLRDLVPMLASLFLVACENRHQGGWLFICKYGCDARESAVLFVVQNGL